MKMVTWLLLVISKKCD